MDRPKLEVADVIRRYGQAYRDKHGASVSSQQRRVMTAVELCRTAALGGHLEQCDRCGHERNAYNSCANRHCPKCQSLARAQWLENRRSELLQTQYFHVVFTVPEQIAAIAYQNKRTVYGILFQATAETLRTIAADPQHLGAEIGFFAVLHTWGQNLLHHPHLHCVVPGGGLSADGTRWIACHPGFFLSVRVLSRLFRRLFLDKLVKAFDCHKLEFFSALEHCRDRQAFLRYLAPTREIEWVVYAKRPFAGPEQVLDFPSQPRSIGEPIAVFGKSLQGDFFFVKYLGEDRIALGYDHWGSGGPISAPISISPRREYRLDILIYPLLPKLEVFFEGRLVLTHGSALYPHGPNELYLGQNPIGGTVADPKFSGALRLIQSD